MFSALAQRGGREDAHVLVLLPLRFSFIYSFIHPFVHPPVHSSSRTSCIARTAVSELFFYITARSHTHTEHEVCHTHMHTHGARGANHHRALTGPVCEWEIFFSLALAEDESAVAPSVFIASPSCPAFIFLFSPTNAAKTSLSPPAGSFCLLIFDAVLCLVFFFFLFSSPLPSPFCPHFHFGFYFSLL